MHETMKGLDDLIDGEKGRNHRGVEVGNMGRVTLVPHNN